jgi:Circularly permutated YpsA SLOG family
MATTGVAVLRIISGGQTGADQGGLMAARELGIRSGGTAPKDWWTETGSAEQLLRSFGLIECSEPGYDARTRANVLDSDGTLLLGSYATGGSAMTAKVATEARKAFFHVPFPRDKDDKGLEIAAAELRAWLKRFQIRVLNVAGNRESQNPGLQEFTRRFLVSALHEGFE